MQTQSSSERNQFSGRHPDQMCRPGPPPQCAPQPGMILKAAKGMYFKRPEEFGIALNHLRIAQPFHSLQPDGPGQGSLVVMQAEGFGFVLKTHSPLQESEPKLVIFTTCDADLLIKAADF